MIRRYSQEGIGGKKMSSITDATRQQVTNPNQKKKKTKRKPMKKQLYSMFLFIGPAFIFSFYVYPSGRSIIV